MNKLAAVLGIGIGLLAGITLATAGTDSPLPAPQLSAQ